MVTTGGQNATTDSNPNVILLPSNLSSISATPWIQLRSLNAIIKVNTITP